MISESTCVLCPKSIKELCLYIQNNLINKNLTLIKYVKHTSNQIYIYHYDLTLCEEKQLKQDIAHISALIHILSINTHTKYILQTIKIKNEVKLQLHPLDNNLNHSNNSNNRCFIL